MLKVNDEKLLADVAEINGRIAQKDEKACRIANDIAAQRNMGAEFADGLKKLIVASEPEFNTDKEKAELDVLMKYVDNVEEEVATEPIV